MSSWSVPGMVSTPQMPPSSPTCQIVLPMRSQDSWVTQPACSRLCDPDLGSSHDHKGFHLDTPPISTPPHPPLPTHQGCAVIFPCRVLPPSEWWRTSKYSTAPHLRFLPVPSCPLLKCLLSQSAVPYESHRLGISQQAARHSLSVSHCLDGIGPLKS